MSVDSYNTLSSLIIRIKYHLPDLSRNLWDDCVPEHFNSVCPIGNPISHSTHIGFNCPLFSALTASGKELVTVLPFAFNVSGFLAPL